MYDQNFRQQAAEVGSTEWARVDPSIYTQCFTGMALSAEGWCKFCQSIDHASENCPSRQHWQRKRGVPAASSQSMPQTKRVVSANAICRKYNCYDRDCHFGKTCRFQHVCSICKGPHPVTKCGQGGKPEKPE